VKSTRRRPQRQDASALLSGEGKALFGAWVIRAAKSPYGPRPRWGQVEYVQAAICALYPGGLPRNFNATSLTTAVREQLAKDHGYRAIGFSKPVSRWTVLRAVELLRAANEPN
jgi:hypothetical protein